jgi:hypothetical protein
MIRNDFDYPIRVSMNILFRWAKERDIFLDEVITAVVLIGIGIIAII